MRLAGLENHVGKVLSLPLLESVIALNELNTFYNEFGVDQVARVNVNLSGTLNDLKAMDEMREEANIDNNTDKC